MTRVTMDFETRSRVSLAKIGAWLYSIDPSTEPIALAWSDGILEEGQWHNGDPAPMELFNLINGNGAVVEAHNAFFEWCIWNNICVPRFKWPVIDWHRWRCSLSKVAACSLPKSLGSAGKILNLKTVKDEAWGKWAMMKMSKPKKDGTWHEAENDRIKMAEYNMTDVLSEECLSNTLPDLSPTELEIWRMTEEINRRGIMIDVAGCRKAVAMAGEYARKLTDEFSNLTGLDTAGQRAKFITWLAGRGHQLGNTQADTLDKFIKSIIDEEACRSAQIVREIGRSSIKKYRACLDMAAPDGRARGTIAYHAAHTGRWSGRGLQPQNFKRECRWNMDQAWKDVHAHDLETIELIYGNPLQFLAEITRGALVAAPGRVLMAGDWAQIEPRVLFWQAGEQRGLESFRRGEDVYLEMAMLIFNRKLNKKDHPEERFLGKHAVLALGYGAGYVKFLIHCRDLGAPRFGRERVKSLVPASWLNATMRWIWTENWQEVLRKMPEATREDVWDLALCKFIVDKYRKQYKKTVVKYWHDVEDAARRAIQNPGVTYKVAHVAYTCGKQFLNCRLPSGRLMRYFQPKLSSSGAISYMTPEEFRKTTYGGSMVENLTQAMSRDIMAERMLALRQTEEYCDIVLTVHDEVVSEVDEGVGSLDEFLDILAIVPDWCHGVPIKVEGFISKRYKKG